MVGPERPVPTLAALEMVSSNNLQIFLQFVRARGYLTRDKHASAELPRGRVEDFPEVGEHLILTVWPLL
jgi:hypothetical protein